MPYYATCDSAGGSERLARTWGSGIAFAEFFVVALVGDLKVEDARRRNVFCLDDFCCDCWWLGESISIQYGLNSYIMLYIYSTCIQLLTTWKVQHSLFIWTRAHLRIKVRTPVILNLNLLSYSVSGLMFLFCICPASLVQETNDCWHRLYISGGPCGHRGWWHGALQMCPTHLRGSNWGGFCLSFVDQTI